jgi:translation elongation factor EF-Tu-like GTPase
MSSLIGRITWKSHDVTLSKRPFLFCFGDKCMSGRIKTLNKVRSDKEFQVEVDFIEPAFFENEAVVGSKFTIREASRVLGEGVVTRLI